MVVCIVHACEHLGDAVHTPAASFMPQFQVAVTCKDVAHGKVSTVDVNNAQSYDLIFLP